MKGEMTVVDWAISTGKRIPSCYDGRAGIFRRKVSIFQGHSRDSLLIRCQRHLFRTAPDFGRLTPQPVQQSLKDLEHGYKNFFRKRAAFTRFKKRGQNDAFRYPQGVKLDQTNSRISLPKLGWIRYRNSREVIGEVKNATISQGVNVTSVSRRNTKFRILLTM